MARVTFSVYSRWPSPDIFTPHTHFIRFIAISLLLLQPDQMSETLVVPCVRRNDAICSVFSTMSRTELSETCCPDGRGVEPKRASIYVELSTRVSPKDVARRRLYKQYYSICIWAKLWCVSVFVELEGCLMLLLFSVAY